MAKLSRSNGNKKNGLKFKIVVEKLQKSFLLGKRSPENHFEEFDNSKDVPNDVKEGHFAVMAVDDDDKLKRFIVPLSCLRNPCFLSCWKKLRAEEYGFEHEGALMLPCRSSELEKILGKQYNRRADWSSRNLRVWLSGRARAEEYGFEHEGALMLPCRSSELEKILGKQYNRRADWSSRNLRVWLSGRDSFILNQRLRI